MSVAMITLTMRHDKGHRLEALWNALSKSWGRVTGGKAWVSAVDRFGILGWLRVVEVTFGKNGWHVHVHALVFADDLSASKLDQLADGMFGRWSRSLQRCGLGAPLLNGQDWHLIDGAGDGSSIGDYLAKAFRQSELDVNMAGSIGAEMALTQSKTAQRRHSTRPVWELLDQAILGVTPDIWQWHEWEKGSKGRRQIAWSKGLRQALGLIEAEKSDEEIAAEELGSKDDTVVYITRFGWGQLVRQPELIPDVLNAAEQLGAEGLSEWLWEQGIEHRRA